MKFKEKFVTKIPIILMNMMHATNLVEQNCAAMGMM